jgi:hypothetical protein
MPDLASGAARVLGRAALLTLVAVGVVSCRAFSPTSPASAQTQPPRLSVSGQAQAPPIPTEQLAQRGVVLTAADPGTPTTVTQAQAETTALNDSGIGTIVLNSALMTLNNSGSADTSLCWIFSLNSGNLLPTGPYNAGGSGPATRLRANFEVVAVDATTGLLVLHVEGHDPTLPELTPPADMHSEGKSPSR